MREQTRDVKQKMDYKECKDLERERERERERGSRKLLVGGAEFTCMYSRLGE